MMGKTLKKLLINRGETMRWLICNLVPGNHIDFIYSQKSCYFSWSFLRCLVHLYSPFSINLLRFMDHNSKEVEFVVF